MMKIWNIRMNLYEFVLKIVLTANK